MTTRAELTLQTGHGVEEYVASTEDLPTETAVLTVLAKVTAAVWAVHRPELLAARNLVAGVLRLMGAETPAIQRPRWHFDDGTVCTRPAGDCSRRHLRADELEPHTYRQCRLSRECVWHRDRLAVAAHQFIDCDDPARCPWHQGIPIVRVHVLADCDVPERCGWHWSTPVVDRWHPNGTRCADTQCPHPHLPGGKLPDGYSGDPYGYIGHVDGIGCSDPTCRKPHEQLDDVPF